MFRAFDLFQQGTKLKYNASSSFSTHAGFFFTICVVAITLVLAIPTFRSIFNYHSPQIAQDRTQVNDPGLLTLDSSEFHFMLHMWDLNFSSAVVSFKMYYFTSIKDETGYTELNYVEIPYKRCTLDYLKNYTVGTYPPEIFDSAICPDTSQIQLNGSAFENPVYQSVLLEVVRCVNDTNHPDIVCKPSDEIDDYLENNMIQVNLFYTNTIMSPTNYSNPFTYFIDTTFWYLIPGQFSLEADVRINQQDIITDDNLLVEDWNPTKQTTFQIDPQEIQTRFGKILTPDGEEVLLDIYLGRSNKQYTTKRQYPKLQQGLANVGSVFGVCVGVFGIIAAMYVSKAYSLNIANQLYEFDLESPSKGLRPRRSATIIDQKIKSSKNKKGKNLNKQTSNKASEDANSESDGLEKVLLVDKAPIRYSFREFLLDLMPCCRRKKGMLIKQAIRAAEKEIDLLEILKKLQELEKLKKILLDEDELMMLSYCQPAMIPLQTGSSKKKKGNQGSRLDVDTTSFNTTEVKLKSTSKKSKPKTILLQEDLESPKKSDSTQINLKTSSKDEEKNESERALAVAANHYNRLLKKMKHSSTSRKILTFIDPKVSNALFDMGKNSLLTNIQPVEDREVEVSVQEKDKKAQEMSKIEAGSIISKHLEKYYMKRKTKQESRNSGYQNDQEDEVFSASDLSEMKESLKYVNPHQIELTNRFDFDSGPRSPTITIQLQNRSPSLINSPNDRTNPLLSSSIKFGTQQTSGIKTLGKDKE